MYINKWTSINRKNTCLYAWITQTDYKQVRGSQTDWNNDKLNIYGPITAMSKLNSATSTWINLEKIKVSTFNDDSEQHMKC